VRGSRPMPRTRTFRRSNATLPIRRQVNIPSSYPQSTRQTRLISRLWMTAPLLCSC
jgi:hypothetical protein